MPLFSLVMFCSAFLLAVLTSSPGCDIILLSTGVGNPAGRKEEDER